MGSTALTRARSWTVGILSASAVATGIVGVHLAEDHAAAVASTGTSPSSSTGSQTPQQQSNSATNCADQPFQQGNQPGFGGSGTQLNREDGEHDHEGGDDEGQSHEAELSAFVTQSPQLAQLGQPAQLGQSALLALAADPCQTVPNNQGSQPNQANPNQNGFGSPGQLGSGSGAPQVMSRGS